MNEVKETYEKYSQTPAALEGFNELTSEELQKKHPAFPRIKTEFKTVEDTQAGLVAAEDYITGMASYVKSKENLSLF